MINSKQAIFLIKKKLENPNSWSRGTSWGMYFFGIKRCLHTVVEDVVMNIDMIERRKVYDCLFRNLPEPFLCITSFNDSPQTNHNDLMNYLDKVKQELSLMM